MIWAWAFPGALLTGLVAAPFVREALRKPVSDTARADAPGAMIDLPQGATYYRWRGPETGPVAVCVHGLTTPSAVWDNVADGLTHLGFRVLTYDLYGRGLSAQVRGPQDAAFFTRQLHDLLDALKVSDDITLLGYSMGGAIAPTFAAAYPGRLRQMVLIAPVGLGHDLGPATRLITNTGALGTWAMHALYPRSFRHACESERGAAGQMADVQIAQLNRRGFVPSVLSSLRGIMDWPMGDTHRAIAATDLPVLAIWGADDDIIPLSGRAELSALNPGATHEVIEGAGHSLTYTDSAAVVTALERWLALPDN
ncbi:alpha/beta hydrolase [Rhodobacteraceae bacterium KMM 6894]|nr:alpha/beta hydrolase [Rhodobacteraceae bacterium KMM 6894]